MIHSGLTVSHVFIGFCVYYIYTVCTTYTLCIFCMYCICSLTCHMSVCQFQVPTVRVTSRVLWVWSSLRDSQTSTLTTWSVPSSSSFPQAWMSPSASWPLTWRTTPYQAEKENASTTGWKFGTDSPEVRHWWWQTGILGVHGGTAGWVIKYLVIRLIAPVKKKLILFWIFKSKSKSFNKPINTQQTAASCL